MSLYLLAVDESAAINGRTRLRERLITVLLVTSRQHRQRTRQQTITTFSMYKHGGSTYSSGMSPMRAPVLFRHVGKTLVIVPALYLTLLHFPCGRLFALVALRRNQGSLLA
jgi:hypothetical protein